MVGAFAMSESKIKKRKFDKLLKQHPNCIYCGGKTRSTSIDHCPPIALFEQRQRPSGMEFPACSNCHEGTRTDDLVANMASRIFPDAQSEIAKEEVEKSIKGVANNVPGLLEEMKPSFLQTKKVRRLQGNENGNLHALNCDGPILQKHILRFAARPGFALHFEATNQVIPLTGGTGVSWVTNYNAYQNQLPNALLQLLPAPRTLRQGKKSVDGQFFYSSVITDDSNMSAHYATFRESFAIWAVCGIDADKISSSEPMRHYKVFQPGFLSQKE